MNEKKFSPGAEESLRLSQEAAGELSKASVNALKKLVLPHSNT